MMRRSRNDSSKPLQYRTFFLDVKNPQIRVRLTDCITKLGGSIGQFLDKKVKYVVTDRPEKDWPTREQIARARRNALLLHGSHESTSPNSEISSKNVDLLPRGKMVALKATTNASSLTNISQPTKSNSIDVLNLAAERGYTILVANNVLAFCETSLAKGDEKNSNWLGNHGSAIGHVKLRPLKSPFIKVDDAKKSFRPSVKEFKEWPDICLDREPFLSPFGSPQQPNNHGPKGFLLIPRNHENPEEIAMMNQLPQRTTESPKASHITLTPVHTTTTPTITGTSKTFERFGIITPKLSPYPAELKDIRPLLKRRSETLNYCDICGISFSHLNEHLATSKHIQEVENKENYKDLIRVIKSLPPWTEICDEKPNSEIQSEGEEEYSGPHYPSLTPPSNSSTTITLTCGSTRILGQANGKGTFVSLHDIATKNNNGGRRASINLTPTTTHQKSKTIDLNGIMRRSSINGNILNFSVDRIDEELESDVVGASCITPPLMPPLLLQELDLLDDETSFQVPKQVENHSKELSEEF